MGGTTDIGFCSDSRYLLVASMQGRGVFEIESCERVARDSDWPGTWHHNSTIEGIGPLEGMEVPVRGFENPTSKRVLEQLGGFDLNGHVTEFVSADISKNDQFLAIGYSSDVQLYRRG